MPITARRSAREMFDACSLHLTVTPWITAIANRGGRRLRRDPPVNVANLLAKTALSIGRSIKIPAGRGTRAVLPCRMSRPACRMSHSASDVSVGQRRRGDRAPPRPRPARAAMRTLTTLRRLTTLQGGASPRPAPRRPQTRRRSYSCDRAGVPAATDPGARRPSGRIPSRDMANSYAVRAWQFQ